MHLVGFNEARDSFVITAESWDKRPQQAPCSVISNGKGKHLLEKTEDVARWIQEEYSSNKISPAASLAIARVLAAKEEAEDFPSTYVYKNPPLEKQREAIHRAWSKPTFALFMQVGTGKTYVVINVSTALFLTGKIDSVIVMCPTGVKPVWEIEVGKHSPINAEVVVVEPDNKHKLKELRPSNKIRYVVVGIEALSQGSAADMVMEYASKHRCLGVVDESHLIKNPKSNRTSAAISIGAMCNRRMILTGTSVTQGIEDLFAQFMYLDWKIIGNKSFFSFKAKYCITGGFRGKAIIGYQCQDQLLNKISPYTFNVSKREMMDLPDQVYESIQVSPSKEQSKALIELGDPFEMMTVINDVEVEVKTILERMLRYQQIVGGHYPCPEDNRAKIMPGENPKMKAVIDLIESMRPYEKVIIWARFVPEIELIYNTLEDKFPGAACTYYGSTPEDKRKYILERFQEDPNVRFFVSNQTVGGAGITLTSASNTIYYSNTFSYKDREQSEGRNHRKGQVNKVTYFDIIMDHKIDKLIISALKRKKSIDAYVKEELAALQLKNVSYS